MLGETERVVEPQLLCAHRDTTKFLGSTYRLTTRFHEQKPDCVRRGLRLGYMIRFTG